MKFSVQFSGALLAAAVSTLQPVSSYACKMARPIPTLSDELVSFNTCQELESHVNKLSQNVYSKWDEGYGGFTAGMKKGRAKESERRSAQMPTKLAAPSSNSIGAAGAGSVMEAKDEAAKSTGTNNQVANVDEADFVKFNGRFIFQIHGGQLRILKAWPASALNQVGSLAISGQPHEMLMNDTSAVVLSNENQNLKATVVDITNPSQPRVLTEFHIPGQYKTARLVGDTLRIVNQDYNAFAWTTRTEANSNGWIQEETVARTLNIKPTTQSLHGNSRTLDVVKDCKNVWVPKDIYPQVLTRIISIDLKAKKYEETMAYIEPGTVYASEGAIYLAQTGYSQKDNRNQQQTAVHKFAIPSGQTARYQASGLINGHLINQFALDEHNNYLRVATNGTEFTGGNFLGYGGEWKQISRVQVLNQSGNRLKVVGKTEELAKGERLYSARFDGDKGYIVTFRQVDPLFTIDLKNPYRPRVIGELKVPGFSTYIHMMGKNHLLTIGQDADEQTGRPRGMKLSVFDVSNFAKPREVKSLIFKSDVASESSYEHKAFTFYQEKGVLAIPATQQSRSSLLLFKVSPSEIKPAGEVNMADMQAVRRSFFADNFVYAIGGLGVRAAALDNPQVSVGTVFFDRNNVAEMNW